MGFSEHPDPRDGADMSRVHFTSRSGEAELMGFERAHCQNVVSDIAVSLLRLNSSWILQGDNLPWSELAPGKDEQQLRWCFTGIIMEPFVWKGHEISPWRIMLNTVLRLGSDPLRLMARLHAQCEIHSWVDGPNRAWLASIIDEGLESGLYRESGKWGEVAEFLRSSDSEIVALSYTVTECWPNGYACGYNSEEDAEAFYEFDSDKKFDLCEEWLRTANAGQEMKPDNWASYYFGDGLSGFDLLAPDWRERLDGAMTAETEPR